MKDTPNAEIREAIKKSSLNKYEIAYEIGIADTTFSVWLRKELSDDKKTLILNAIKKLSAAC